MLIKCLKGLNSQKSLFVSKFKRGSDPVTDPLTKVRYRAAAKNGYQTQIPEFLIP